MEAKDLRIGNLIYQFDTVENVTVDTFNALDDGFSKDSFEPIPLTEEWLIKFGFKTDFYGGQGNVCYYASKGKFKIYSIEDNKSYQYDYTLNMFTMIKHVHELQNLYFALTGEELAIKK